MEPFDVFGVLERELLPPKKRKQLVSTETQVCMSNMPVPVMLIKEEPKGSLYDVMFVSATPGIKEEHVNPKMEEISDEDDDEDEADEDEEETVWTLIKDWKLNDELRPIFEKYQITLNVLQNMTEDDVKVMIPADQIAIRILLRTQLQKWQKFNGYGPFSIENMPSTSTATITSNNCERPSFGTLSSTSHNLNNEDLLSKDLESILKTSPKGKRVLDYRFLYPNEILAKNWRFCLCEAIADYCIQRKHILKNTHFNHLSNEIVRLFPSENKDEYFTPRISKEVKTVSDPCGYLVEEYNYQCEKLRQSCQPPSRWKERKRPSSPKSPVYTCTKEQYEVSKLWLKKNIHPWFEPKGVIYKWKLTFRYRRTSFMSSERKEPIVDQWPVLRHTLGHSLIESDFNQIFADKSQALYEKWDYFCTKILPIFETDIQDSLGYRLYESLPRLENKEMKDCIYCQLINSVLAPTELIALKMITPEGKKKSTVWKPSMRDARTSFFNLAYSEENAKSIATVMANRYTAVGLIPQPLIFGIGYKDENIKKFVVIYHNICYTVHSFLKALDIVFKLYHVFGLEYNRESHLMWLLIQKYFFNIVTPYDLKSPGLNKLMSRLR